MLLSVPRGCKLAADRLLTVLSYNLLAPIVRGTARTIESNTRNRALSVASAR